MAFLKTLMIYYLTPLYSAHLVKETEIKSIEGRLKKLIFSAPSEVKFKIILNLTTSEEESTCEIIKRLAKKLMDVP